MGKQGKHLLGHPNHVDGKSEITISLEEMEQLLKDGIDHGQMVFTNKGEWNNKIRISTNKKIGKYISKASNEDTDTDTVVISFSKRGAHLVPGRPSNEFRRRNKQYKNEDR